MQRFAPILSILTLTALGAAPAHAQWSTDALSLQRTGLATVNVGSLALFAGGGENSPQPFSVSAVVDIYDSASGTWSTAALSVARAELAATVVGNLAFFAGGVTSPTVPSAVVDVFDAQTLTWSTATLSQARTLLGATTVGTKAFFAGGGIQASPQILSDRIDIYDASIGLPGNPAAWSTATLSHTRVNIAAVSVGSLALFAGGYEGTGTSGTALVEIYDDSTGLWSTSALSQARMLDRYAAVSLGTRAYFAGGITNVGTETRSDRVDIYDAQTSTWSTATLSAPRSGLGAGAVGTTVLFAGGLQNGLPHVASPIVDILDAATGNWLAPAALPVPHGYIDAVTVGGRVMFPGGKLGSGLGTTSLIDVYDPSSPSTSFCVPAQAGVIACPCSNPAGGANRGCDNSSATGGAQLTASGQASLASDTLVFVTSGEKPTATSIVLQGNAEVGSGVAFGQGVRCVGGGLKRLYVKTASSGSITAPSPGDPSVSSRSASLGDTITAGTNRWYAVYYRDPIVLGGCSATSTFNTTQTQMVPWM